MGRLGKAHFLLKEGGTLGDLYSLRDLKRDGNGLIFVTKTERLLRSHNDPVNT